MVPQGAFNVPFPPGRPLHEGGFHKATTCVPEGDIDTLLGAATPPPSVAKS